MDPRERAEAALARARARGSYVVTPDDAVSPMDAKSTIQIPRSLIMAAVRRDEDPEATMVVPASTASGFGDDRTTSIPSPMAPRSQDTEPYEQYDQYEDYDDETVEADDPLAHSPSTQPLHLQQIQQQLQQARRPEPETVHEEQDGIIPTTTTVTRRSLAQRLDGD